MIFRRSDCGLSGVVWQVKQWALLFWKASIHSQFGQHKHPWWSRCWEYGNAANAPAIRMNADDATCVALSKLFYVHFCVDLFPFLSTNTATDAKLATAFILNEITNHKPLTATSEATVLSNKDTGFERSITQFSCFPFSPLLVNDAFLKESGYEETKR